MTINEALTWKKTLLGRHAELVSLRDSNSYREKRFYGAHADKETERTPVYSVKALDRLVTQVARELRELDNAIKRTNAVTQVLDYTPDEGVLGEVSEE